MESDLNTTRKARIKELESKIPDLTEAEDAELERLFKFVDWAEECPNCGEPCRRDECEACGINPANFFRR